jgi:hypothetical protein
MADLPLACTLTPETMRTRRAGLLPGLLERADSRETLPEGYRVRFAATDDILPSIRGPLTPSASAAGFSRFLMTVEPDGGPITLDITGPTGTREFLDALITEV